MELIPKPDVRHANECHALMHYSATNLSHGKGFIVALGLE